ncbi:hypothetical protein H6G33_30270 [Calothrix sp. FACHB-1219]|uniref:Hint domain-containing protein n=1 Tax=unclassified Calothrix TaxID=2619626 RepID=UPI001683A1B0|nr:MULTISPECIES: Hint domain-containing protein [unclassified Calothrix]MBD2204088.1 hypothetical protein [Calothrix sp. FACHB-168]MBD2221261.1 hypothetical protein [Calothrix sp. FACHB-1219]
MKNRYFFSKILCISLIFILFFAFWITDSAYARGGCFASGTAILTVDGVKPIEKLHPGDSIISYNFTKQSPEIGKIGEIQVVSSPEYYLINHQIKVTATHPFYIKTSTGVKLLQTQQLKLGDRLIGLASDTPVISSIDYIQKPITVYNLISVNPNHNFYAEGILVHNKGGGGGGGSGGGGFRGSYGSRSGNGGAYTPINAKTLPKLILATLTLVLVLLPVLFFRELYNLVRFYGKQFSNDSDLIQFTTKINPKFTNRYSLRYIKNQESWKQIPIASEIYEQQYQHIFAKSELVEQVSKLFIQYQRDWTMKKFNKMQAYIKEPFYSQQCQIFQSDFGDNFDVIYHPEVMEVAPISFYQDENKYILRFQINAKMTNFVLSPKGYVLSGESYPLLFTEYWDFIVDSDKNFYLKDISQICSEI